MADAGAIRAGRAYVELSADIGQLESGLRRAQAKVRAFGEGVKNAGASLIKLGVGASIPLALGANAFANFEQAMARVKALTGATEPEFAALNAEAKRLGLDTVFSARQAAETMGVFALAGFKVNDIINAMAPTLDAAAAGQMDLALAADIGMKAMHGMGYQSKDLRYILDVLGKAMVTANTDLVMLGEAFKYVGPIARAAGISLEEITAAIQILSDAGIQADMAGTTLRGAILSITSPSVEAKSELDRLGVSVNTAKGNFRGLVPIISDLEKAMKDLGTGQRLESLGKIFPARAAAGMAVMVTEGGAKLAERLKQLGSVTGTIGKIAATQLDTLKGSSILLMSSIEGLGIAIGATLSPILRGLAEGLTLVTNLASRWSDENPTLYRTIALVAGGVIVAGGALVMLGASIKITALALGGLLIPLALIKGVVVIGTIVLITLKGVLLSLLTPLGLVVAALDVFRGYLLSSTYQSGNALANLRDNFLSLRDTATQAFSAIRDAIAGNDLSLALEIAGAGMAVAWQKILGSLREAWDWLANWFSRGGGKFVSVFDTVIETVKDLFDGLWYLILRGWNRTLGFLKKQWESNKFWKSDASIQAKVDQIQAETDAEAESLMADRNSRSGARWSDLAGRKKIYGEGVDEEIRKRNEATATANATGVADAQAKLDALVRRAEIGKYAATALADWGGLGMNVLGHFGIGGRKGNLPDGGDVSAQIGKVVDVQGTFSGAAAGRLGVGKSVMDDIKKNGEVANDLLRRVVKHTEPRGGPVITP